MPSPAPLPAVGDHPCRCADSLRTRPPTLDGVAPGRQSARKRAGCQVVAQCDGCPNTTCRLVRDLCQVVTSLADSVPFRWACRAAGLDARTVEREVILWARAEIDAWASGPHPSDPPWQSSTPREWVRWATWRRAFGSLPEYTETGGMPHDAHRLGVVRHALAAGSPTDRLATDGVLTTRAILLEGYEQLPDQVRTERTDAVRGHVGALAQADLIERVQSPIAVLEQEDQIEALIAAVYGGTDTTPDVARAIADRRDDQAELVARVIDQVEGIGKYDFPVVGALQARKIARERMHRRALAHLPPFIRGLAGYGLALAPKVRDLDLLCRHLRSSEAAYARELLAFWIDANVGYVGP